MKSNHDNRPVIKEIIICEGRDDTIQINKAVDCMTIETHGFGIKKETWDLIEKAYEEKGIIIFTDPDFSGEEIRRKLSKRFPNAKHAFLTQGEATHGLDIGVENASPKNIVKSLKKAKCTIDLKEEPEFTLEDMIAYGLQGTSAAKENRQKVGKILGIGYGNCKSFLAKLNKFSVSRKEFYEAVRTINH